MFKKIIATLIFIQPFFAGTAFGGKAMDILAESDNYRSRFVQSKMDVVINSFKNGSLKDTETYMVYSNSGMGKTLIEMTSGRNSGDRVLLTNNGMFIALKRASRPVRITPLQRLLGQASYGDLASLRFANDYNAEIINEEQDSFVLELTAKSKHATYVKMHFWVAKKDNAPQKADAFLASGKLFKQLSYVVDDGKVSKIIYYSPNMENSKTEMVFKSIEAKKLPKRLFTNTGMRGRIN